MNTLPSPYSYSEPDSGKVLIEKCTDPSAWYADKIGQTFGYRYFEALRNPEQGIPENVFWVRTGDTWNTLNYIRASDCKLVP